MGAKKLFNGRGRWRACWGRDQCLQELEELFAGASGEKWSRVSDDIGVFAIAEIEADGHSTRVRIGVVVRYHRYSCRVGEPDVDRRRLGVEMRCTRELLGLCGRCKHAIEQDSFCMRCK